MRERPTRALGARRPALIREVDEEAVTAEVPVEESDEGIRLQRVLAQAGVGSRRACEEIIEQGRVTVDGRTVRTQGMRVDPQVAIITVDGQRLVTKSELEHMVLNKPAGVLSAMSDARGMPTVGDYVADRNARLFHVGRLDVDSEGLLLLTNDGELAHRLTHPSYGVLKTYLVEIAGGVPKDLARQLKAGVELEDGIVLVDGFAILGTENGRTHIELILHEGRKHIVRRLMEETGHPVLRLVRTQIGPISLGTLKQGRLRHLTSHEVGALYTMVDL